MAATQWYMDGVRADQWHAPTPNTEWDVKQVANHIIGENLWAGGQDDDLAVQIQPPRTARR
jgi:hypothetical protein